MFSYMTRIYWVIFMVNIHMGKKTMLFVSTKRRLNFEARIQAIFSPFQALFFRSNILGFQGKQNNRNHSKFTLLPIASHSFCHDFGMPMEPKSSNRSIGAELENTVREPFVYSCWSGDWKLETIRNIPTYRYWYYRWTQVGIYTWIWLKFYGQSEHDDELIIKLKIWSIRFWVFPCSFRLWNPWLKVSPISELPAVQPRAYLNLMAIFQLLQ